MQKTIGDNGVFATVIQSGWAMGIPNADSALYKVPPLSTVADVHNKAVRDYFVSAGLPQDQVGYVNAHATVHTTSTGAGLPSAPIFDRYSTVISRTIDGVPIADSFAWAVMNANGDVVEESVYWPDIASAAIADAKALQAVLADPVGGANFRSKLPSALGKGLVVVHHTPCVGGTAETRATYDAIDPSTDGVKKQRHFDASGREVILATEAVSVGPSSAKRQFMP